MRGISAVPRTLPLASPGFPVRVPLPKSQGQLSVRRPHTSGAPYFPQDWGAGGRKRLAGWALWDPETKSQTPAQAVTPLRGDDGFRQAGRDAGPLGRAGKFLRGGSRASWGRRGEVGRDELCPREVNSLPAEAASEGADHPTTDHQLDDTDASEDDPDELLGTAHALNGEISLHIRVGSDRECPHVVYRMPQHLSCPFNVEPRVASREPCRISKTRVTFVLGRLRSRFCSVCRPFYSNGCSVCSRSA